jgi:S-adenosylmethionine:tRNA ribosyltransferase-isomerase
MAIGETVPLPLGAKMTLLEKGRPQKVRVDQKLTDGYFEQVAELPLPPYIQKARKERHTVNEDANWYQTAWAKEPGSMAAPTASLHFSAQDLHALRARGVHIVELTLHVGLGTFLPVTSEDLNDHVMHEEYVQIPKATWQAVRVAQKENRGIWAMGTTVARSLESTANGKLPEFEGGFRGLTNLLIQPGYPWQIVNRLLTNFHQPESTLLALVASFSDLNTVKASYSWAMERKFRLFSYGDLSVWIK